jgi:hypothetical protein
MDGICSPTLPDVREASRAPHLEIRDLGLGPFNIPHRRPGLHNRASSISTLFIASHPLSLTLPAYSSHRFQRACRTGRRFSATASGTSFTFALFSRASNSQART